MKFEQVPFTMVEWDRLPVTEDPGETGVARTRAVSANAVRIRLVDFTPNYRADHWCSKGHVVYLLAGSMTVLLEDGRSFNVQAGDSFHVGDDDGRHRVSTNCGAKAFIID